MAVTIDSGHMSYGTTEVVGPELSEKSTKTGNPGGDLSKSSKKRLSVSFPASPMIGDTPDYTHDVVTELRKALLTNTVSENDAADAAAYYGYPTPISEETTPSSADLSFSGAPVIKLVRKDTDGNKIASPWHPNLRPPVQFNPIMDNPIPIIMGGAGTALTAEEADSMEKHVADPYKSSSNIHKSSTDGNQTLPGNANSGGIPSA